MRHVDQEDPRRGHRETAAGDVSRRRFLRHAGLGAGVATIAAVGPAEALMAADGPADEARSAGYHETAHVRRVYQLSRF